RVVEPVLEGGGAFGGELAGACGGEASAGDGVAVVDLGRDVVVDAGLDFGRRLDLDGGGHCWSLSAQVSQRPSRVKGPSMSPQRVQPSGPVPVGLPLAMVWRWAMPSRSYLARR